MLFFADPNGNQTMERDKSPSFEVFNFESGQGLCKRQENYHYFEGTAQFEQAYIGNDIKYYSSVNQ